MPAELRGTRPGLWLASRARCVSVAVEPSDRPRDVLARLQVRGGIDLVGLVCDGVAAGS